MLRELTKILLPAIAVVLCIVPGVIGVLGAPQLAVLPQQLGELTYPEFEVLESTTRRGWFASRMHVVMQPHNALTIAALEAFTDLPPGSPPPQIELDIDLRHGPLPLTAPGRGGLIPALMLANVDAYAVGGGTRTLLPLDATIRRTSRTVAMSVRAQPYYETFDDVSGRQEIRFSGLQMNGTMDERSGRVDGLVEELSLAENGSAIFALKRLSFSASMDDVDTDAINGEARVRVEQVRAGGAVQVGQSVTLTDLEQHVAVASANERVEVSVETGVQGLSVGEWVSDGMTFDLRYDLARASIDELVEIGGIEDEAAVQAASVAWLANAAKSGVGFNVPKWEIKGPEGTSSGSLALNIAPGDDTDPAAVIARTVGDLTLRMPTALVDKLAPEMDSGRDQLESLLGAGYLRRSGQMYETEFKLRDGVLTANELEVPLPF